MVARAVQGLPGLGPRRERSTHRLVLSPACWGISDVRGWGHQLDPERVLSEAAAVGEGVITAGSPGFLPDRSDHAKALLRRHRLRIVAGQVHAILHHHETRGAELAHVDGHAHWLSVLGADTLVLAAIPERAETSRGRSVLSKLQWAQLLHLIGSVEHVCARHKLKLAVRPRFGTIIEQPEDIERVLVGTEAGLCLDIAHLVIAGADPLEVLELGPGRVRHVHLNDVDVDLARRVRERRIDYPEAVSAGLYRPVGEGGAHVVEVIEGLRGAGYGGWFALEEETRLASPDDRPLGRISRSLEYVMPLLA